MKGFGICSCRLVTSMAYPEVDFGGSYVSGRNASMGGKGKIYVFTIRTLPASLLFPSKTSLCGVFRPLGSEWIFYNSIYIIDLCFHKGIRKCRITIDTDILWIFIYCQRKYKESIIEVSSNLLWMPNYSQIRTIRSRIRSLWNNSIQG